MQRVDTVGNISPQALLICTAQVTALGFLTFSVGSQSFIPVTSSCRQLGFDI